MIPFKASPQDDQTDYATTLLPPSRRPAPPASPPPDAAREPYVIKAQQVVLRTDNAKDPAQTLLLLSYTYLLTKTSKILHFSYPSCANDSLILNK